VEEVHENLARYRDDLAGRLHVLVHRLDILDVFVPAIRQHAIEADLRKARRASA
jgi:hypothetical protein